MLGSSAEVPVNELKFELTVLVLWRICNFVVQTVDIAI